MVGGWFACFISRGNGSGMRGAIVHATPFCVNPI
jgi:hypothetical protein